MIYLPKSQPAPESLQHQKALAKGTHRQHDVMDMLQSDFKNKCYLCEYKAPIGIDVDHFIPHQGNRDLEFDWNNLFLSCKHCNGIKSIRTDLLNCTTDKSVDSKIRFGFSSFPKETISISSIDDSVESKNTVALLISIYYSTTPNGRIESENIREALFEKINLFLGFLEKYAANKYEETEKSRIKEKIITGLNPASPFTAFKRWIIRANDRLFQEFGTYLEN